MLLPGTYGARMVLAAPLLQQEMVPTLPDMAAATALPSSPRRTFAICRKHPLLKQLVCLLQETTRNCRLDGNISQDGSSLRASHTTQTSDWYIQNWAFRYKAKIKLIQVSYQHTNFKFSQKRHVLGTRCTRACLLSDTAEILSFHFPMPKKPYTAQE